MARKRSRRHRRSIVNESPVQHEWYNQTTLHPIGLVAVVALGLIMLVAPRRFAALPIIVMACFVPKRRPSIYVVSLGQVR